MGGGLKVGGGGLTEVGSCPQTPGYDICTCVNYNDLLSDIVSQLQYIIYASIS